jgi:hypothetical protein
MENRGRDNNHRGDKNTGKGIPKILGPGEGGFWTTCPTCLIQNDDDCKFSFPDICRHREWCEAWLNAKTQAKGKPSKGNPKVITC